MTQHAINEKIRSGFVKVIDANGAPLGEMDTRSAIEKAKSLNLDLVLISPNQNPPIAKIMDYGKFLYDLKKKEKKSRKNQTQTKVKEVYVKPNIGEHDLNFRVKNAIEWLNSGNRVRFTIQTYGRLTLHVDLVHQIYNRFMALIGDAGKPESPLKRINAKNHEVIIIPKKKEEKKNAQTKNEDQKSPGEKSQGN